jgi:EgtB-related family protein
MTHQALRGASAVTPARLASPRFRNFYTPERDDIFVGFRTCEL